MRAVVRTHAKSQLLIGQTRSKMLHMKARSDMEKPYRIDDQQ